MLSVLLILPDFLVILAGFLLRRQFEKTVFNAIFWKGAEKLVFYVLFPPLLFTSVATSNLTLSEAGEFLAVAISAMLCAEYAKRGITFLLGTKVTSVAQKEDGIHVAFENRDGAGSVAAARLLLSVGRRPVTQGFGLENLGLKYTERGHIQTDEHLQSSVEGVYVCGDLNGVSLLAHTAVREAEVAVNHVLGVPDRMDYQAVPSVVYTNPEVAGVGATECQLQQRQIPYRVVKVPMAYSGRFVAENEGVNGLFKALVAEDGTVLGVHILGNPASEIISVATIAIETKMKWEDWKKIIFPHPTVCEIFREAF